MTHSAAQAPLRLRWDDPATGEIREWAGVAPVAIGRGADCDIVVNAKQVSRHHARLDFAENGALVLTDQESANGTYVMGERVGRVALYDGATFAIGPFTFLVDLDGDFATAAPGRMPRAALRLRWQAPGDPAPREIPLTGPATIGRAPENTIVLPTGDVSRRHAVVALERGQAILADQNSANGTLVNGERVTRRVLQPGDVIQLGEYLIRVEAVAAAPGGRTTAFHPPAVEDDDDRTVHLDPVREPAAGRTRAGPVFPPPIFLEPIVPVAALAATGVPVEETIYLAVGGGLGSFVWTDYLRISGVPANQIVAIGLEEQPHARYARLCRRSQIPEYERLRSNSDSCPDNIWGWPGYAVREIVHSLGRASFGNAAKVAWQIFGEPTFADTYTPRAGDVFASIDREAARIGWGQIFRYGRVRAIRKTDDGRYVVAYSQSRPGEPTAHRLMLGRYVHIAVGYPGIRLLPDLQAYRQRTHDMRGVVNAYEEHDHVYQQLEQKGGTVLIRGRGIVASRIMQRLYEARQKNPNIGVLHLMRTPIAKGAHFGRAQREVDNHWEYQPFNWPKGTWGGEMLFKLEAANERERDALLNDWGGTTTAKRADWVDIIHSGLREGWYQIRFGEVKHVERSPEGKIVTTLGGKGLIQDQAQLVADYIVDCTGLEAGLGDHPLLKDLVDRNQLKPSVKGRVRVTNDYEVDGMRNGPARMYGAGVMTLGGPMAAVDSFLGLQYAAFMSLRHLRRERAPYVRSLNIFRSPIQWVKWAVNARP